MQWAQRELGVLLDSRELSPTMGTLMRLLRTVDINSRDFYTGLVGKLGSRTSHFIHELKSFARSPFTVDEYDRNAVYGSPGRAKIAIEITNEDIENWSCEILMGESTSSCSSSVVNNFAPSTSSATCALAIGPGPSHTQNTKPPLILLSDDDDANEIPCSSTTTASTSQSTSSCNSKMKSNRSVSTYSARVISSDEDMDSVFPRPFSSRVKSVVIDCRSKRIVDRKCRRLSPSAQREFRMEVSPNGSQPVEATSAQEIAFASTASTTVFELTKTEPDTTETSVLTLDSSVRQISREEYEETKPGFVTSSGNLPAFTSTEVGNGMRIDAGINEAASMDVKIGECPRLGTKVETKQEAKSEQVDHSVTELIGTSAGPSAAVIVDDSGLHSGTPTLTTSSVHHSEQPTIDDSVHSVAGNAGTLDDILALTDDLRPKAVVPDMSTPAAAEINIATTDFPIEVSESEEDAIVFIRQEVFEPPLVELVSGSDTENFTQTVSAPLKRPQQDIPTIALTSENETVGPSTSFLRCEIPPKSLRRYSSTSSDDSNDSMRHRRAKKVLLKRRPKRKRHVWEKFHRRQKRKSSTELRSDAVTSDIPRSPKIFKFSQTETDADLPRVPDSLRPGSLPKMLDQFLEDSDAATEQRNGNGAEQAADQQLSTPQLFDDILSYSAGGYSSDSEGSDSDSFNSRNRYHPYI